MAEVKQTICLKCTKTFSNSSNLKKHLKKFHPDELVSSRNQNKIYNFTCATCGKNFNHKRNFQCHARTHTPSTPSVDGVDHATSQKLNKNFGKKQSRLSKKCPLCNFTAPLKKDLLKHFKYVHEVPIHIKDINFSSLEKFSQWKKNMETQTKSSFVKGSTEICKTHVTTQYRCHRSGNFVSESKGFRHLKTQGSNKINGYCPANIKVVTGNNNKLKIQFIETHIGHDPELGHLQLTADDRQSLATKIASKVAFDDILDQIRDSISDSNLQRIHLLNKKDLYNIEHCFNLSSSAVRHPNDAISVETFVNEMMRDGDSVLFYKPQGTLIEEKPNLKFEDFVLIIMTEAQCELLKKYGSDCICLDGTHGLNSYNFELNTLLVLDDIREGFPCGFLISNRSDVNIFKLFFSEIKTKAGLITPKIFMSDLADSFFNGWTSVMGIPERRLFCTWHVDRAWRTNLSKIRTKENQVSIYKQLRTLLEERDPDAFERMMQGFCNTIDPQTIDFVKYFMNTYGNTCKLWAYCFRMHAGLNTNMHLERMHRTIKYIYLKGKKTKRLDKAISALMRFVRDKLVDRLIVINKGKVCSKLKNIRSRHKNIEKLDSSLLIRTEHGWELPSANTHEIYFVQEDRKTCGCQLICSDCHICIHRYICSCPDCSIKFNMCKHIHLLAQSRKNQESTVENPNAGTEDGDNRLFIHCDESQDIDESQVIVTQLNKRKTKTSIEERKNEIRNRFLKHLDNVQSPTKLDIIEKMTDPLSPTMAAVERHKNLINSLIPRSGQESMPHNSKIPAQRRLWSTKKKSVRKEKVIKKPDATESQKIELSLLL